MSLVVGLYQPRKSASTKPVTEKVGIPRALEALEANDWTQASADMDSDFGEFLGGSDNEDAKSTGKEGNGDLDPESLDFGFDKADFEGLKQAI